MDSPKDAELFAMTAIPTETDEFLKDIGFDKLVAESAGIDGPPELVQLKAKVEGVKVLQRTVDKLKTDLAQIQQKNRNAHVQDEATQKESDEKMAEIARMEEDAARMIGAIPMYEKQASALEADNEELQQKIAVGPGWTAVQSQERASIAEAINNCRTEARDRNASLDNLRSELELMEKSVTASTKRKDKSLAKLDELNVNIDHTREDILSAEQEYNEVERSNGVLIEALNVANTDLADLRAEHEAEKEAADHCVQEVADLETELQTCLKEYNTIAEAEGKTVKEQNEIRCKNQEIEAGNRDKQIEFEVLTKERDFALKERAKASKMRELINEKASKTDSERLVTQREIDGLALTSASASSAVTQGRKEAETLKRQVKRQEHELDLVGRKLGLSKKANVDVADITKANKNTILRQETELSAIKKATGELEKMRGSTVIEESRDQEHLTKILEVIKSKQAHLKSLKDSIHLLEVRSAQAEDLVAEKHNLCELSRQASNAEAKVLIGLRKGAHESKADLVALSTQLKCVQEEIHRSDEMAFKEHIHHHSVDAEREAVETDAAFFNDKSAKLNQKRAVNESVLVALGKEIDNELSKKEMLRLKARNVMNEKDIIISHLVSTQMEHSKIKESLETQGTVNSESEHCYQQLVTELNAAKHRADDLLNEKAHAEKLLKEQRGQSEILASVEQDFNRQLDKNTALAIDIGRPINLHRWRYLQDKDPSQYVMLEQTQKLQRQALKLTDKITTHACSQSSQKMILTKLREEVAGQTSIRDIKSQLSNLKSELRTLSKSAKILEMELKSKIGDAEQIKEEMIELEKKRFAMKAGKLAEIIVV